MKHARSRDPYDDMKAGPLAIVAVCLGSFFSGLAIAVVWVISKL